MNDIVIEGISINELKKTKAALKQGASKFIAESISKVREIVKERLVTATNYSEGEAAAKEALTLLENAQLVSGVSGVSFFLPYYREYGSYGDDDILSLVIDNADHDVLGECYGATTLGRLYSLLGDMEASTRDWHSSSC